MITKITEILTLKDYKLQVKFDDGKQVVYDVNEDIETIESYRLLKTVDGLFEKAHLDESKTVVVWTDAIDLPSDMLYEYGKEIRPDENDALALIDSMLTPQEIIERDLRVEVLLELIKIRRELGLSQAQLAKKIGVKQPAIARMESGGCTPQLNTLIKVLYALGKTLKIVPLEEAKV